VLSIGEVSAGGWLPRRFGAERPNGAADALRPARTSCTGGSASSASLDLAGRGA
jgi:hypothetical protein